MIRVAAGYVGLGVGCAYLLTRPGRQAYDIDTAHIKWAQIHERNAERELPSAYQVTSVEDLRFRFNGAAAGIADDGRIGLDAHTRLWVEREGTQSLAQTVALSALSCFMPLAEAQARLDLPKVLLLSPEQWAVVLHHKKRQCALDVGAGSGHVTRCFAPWFDRVWAVEVSDGLVHRLRQCGFSSVQTREVSQGVVRGLGLPTAFDTVFALNVLDRVPESEAFLSNLVALTARDGRLVVALPLPYCAKPWDSADTRTRESVAWADKNSLALEMDAANSSASWEQSASAIVSRLRREGLEVEHVIRAPYLCQGGLAVPGRGGPLVLDGAVFVARKSIGRCVHTLCFVLWPLACMPCSVLARWVASTAWCMALAHSTPRCMPATLVCRAGS
jgi:SAM-dependent methyltransferase